MSTYPDFTFAHMGLNVDDFEAAEAWYVEHLNMKVLRKQPGNMSFLADPTGRPVLELYSNPDGPNLDLKNTHFLTLHLAVLAEDVEAKTEKLIEAGCRISDPYKVTPVGDKMVMLQDPFGLSIQLIKRKEPMF